MRLSFSSEIARPARRGENGAALALGLLLLSVLTVLGVSGMSTVATELAMAGNTAYQQDAFQAAESGIDLALARAPSPGAPIVVDATALGDGSYTAQASGACVLAAPVADRAFSTDVASAYHYEVVATGSGPRGARSVHHQGFYVIGAPGSGCP
jgi:type IV pilus assembly protein PilX